MFKAILNSQIGRAIIQIAACSFGPHACLAAAGTLTMATGGSIGDAVMSMGMTFISVGTWQVAGGVLEDVVGKSIEGFAERAVVTGTHAAVGGALSVAQGGSFMEGFASAGLGSVGGFAGEGIAGGGPDGFYVRTAFAASAGGLASEITGGKFANGAITAAFAHMFNAEAHRPGIGHNGGPPLESGTFLGRAGAFVGRYIFGPLGALISMTQPLNVGEPGREIELVDGFYEAKGTKFKFSKYYYEKLWNTGRGGPFLISEEVLATSTTIAPDRMPGFFRYTNGSMEMVYNPTTNEVWHLNHLKPR